MRKIIAILALSVSLAGCGAASDTDHIATATSPSTTASKFYTSGTGRLHRAYQAPARELEVVVATRIQFYISTGTGPVGERFLTADGDSAAPSQFYVSHGTGPVGERFVPDRTAQEPQKVSATRNQFYISTGTGPVGERFLAADGDDL